MSLARESSHPQSLMYSRGKTNERAMRVLLIDAALELSGALEEALAASPSTVMFAYSLDTTLRALSSTPRFEFIVVNASEETLQWNLIERLHQFGGDAEVIVFYDPSFPRAIEAFASLPRCKCIPRTGDSRQTTAMIRLAVPQMSPSQTAPPCPPAPPRRTTFSETIVGKSKKMLEVFSLIEKVAPGNANVCIFGESGTGKELIARAIHYNSPRQERPLITFDCTAVPDGLVESHLFGHVKGAFTSAIDHREGVFSLANTGTLFIDELGEFGLPLQAKLLRVIQSREFLKVGGTKPQKTDIRLITATHKDLRQAVAAGTFREDLYYRIVVVTIHLPALRERKEDIPLLTDYFLKKFGRIHRKGITTATPRAMEFLMEFPWPGNVRQLENCIEQAVVLSEQETIDLDVLPLSGSTTEAPLEPPAVMKTGLSLRELERRYILKTLGEVGGNRTRAAKILGISLRGLQYKLKSYTFDEMANSSVDVAVQGNHQTL